MPDQYERWVSSYEMVIHPARVHGRPNAPLSVDALSVIQQAVREAAAIGKPISDEIDRSGRYLFLQDMVVSPKDKRAALLWTIGNKFAAAPVFHNVETSELRTAEMKVGEALAYSAHMVIDFSDPTGTWRYPVALEDIDGISRSRTSELLQRELRKISSVTAVVEGHPKSGLPTVVMNSMPGALMKNGRNRPVMIEVISLRPRTAITADDVSFFVEAKDEYVYKPIPLSTTDELVSALPDFVEELREKHKGYRIRVRWKSDDDEKVRSTQIEPSQRAETLLERAMTRTNLIRVEGAPLADAYAKLEPRLVQALVDELNFDE